MENFKGTKGSWIYKKGNEDQFAGIYFGGYCLNLSDNLFSIEEENANAQLISCALELFEMLEKLILTFEGEGLENYQELRLQEAKQLIKKATE